MLPIVENKEVGRSGALEIKAGASSWLGRKTRMEAYWERAWKERREEFDPTHSLVAKGRIRLVWSLLEPFLQEKQTLVDFGAGWGHFSFRLAERGHAVTAFDIATNALEELPKHPQLTLCQGALPFTTLPDEAFSIVLAVDMLLTLEQSDWRVFLSELARVVQREGVVFLATPLDVTTTRPDLALFHFLSKEFIVEKACFSHDAWAEKLLQKKKGHTPLDQKIYKATTAIARFFFPEKGKRYVVVQLKKKPLSY